MSINFHQQKKSQHKQTPKYFLSSNKNNNNSNSNIKNKSQKRAISQKKFINPDIITQVPASNLYLNNIYSNNQANLNILHQQAFTPINRRKKLYEDDFLIPGKFAKFKDKKTLVLDLDETLVHSSFFPFEKNDIVLNVNFDGIYYNIYVLLRPWVEQFIKEMGKYFEIIIFTASIAAYASPLLDILDKDKNIQYRLYREHCNFVNGVFIKDLKRLNRSLKDVIIIDNSPLAYAFDVDNGLPILSWFDNRNDKELINILPILRFLNKVDDVRKYIKKFLRNNCINYEIAKRVIKDNEEILENKNEENSNKKNKDNEEEKGQSKYNGNISIGEGKNDKSKNKNLFNNFIIKNDIPNLLNDDIKINNLNNLQKLNNKINYLRNEKKSVKLKLQNSNHLIKSFELEKRDNMQMNNNKNSNKKKSDKKNIFRFSLNKKNNNNISPISNKINSHLKLQNLKESNLENDIKINDNMIMPIIFSSGQNTSKNINYQINNNKKNNKDKNFQLKTNNFLKNTNSNSIEPKSLKRNSNFNINSSSQFKYLNLIEKFEEYNPKSSSLKAMSSKKNDSKINNMRKSAKNNDGINNKKNKLNLKNRLRLSSKPMNNLNNNNMDMNAYYGNNKMTDIYSQVLRSKSTGNFVKLQSAHPRTPKTMNNL